MSIKGGVNVPDIVLGDVDIHEHLTLSDLRTIVKHEIDEALIPKMYRFLFRGSPCSVRQESYRRAWECLPICYIQVIYSSFIRLHIYTHTH
jgi:hypothetical protein